MSPSCCVAIGPVAHVFGDTATRGSDDAVGVADVATPWLVVAVPPDAAGHGAADALTSRAPPLGLTSGAPDAWAVPGERQLVAAAWLIATCWSARVMPASAPPTATTAIETVTATCVVLLLLNLRRHADRCRVDT